MNILLITEHWLPQKGGIQRYLFGLSNYLSRQPDVAIQVLAPWNGLGASPPVNGGSASLADKSRLVTRRRFFWPLVKPAWLPFFIHVYKHVQREHIDVIFCGKALFEGLLAYYIKKYLGTPYVVFTYAMEIEEWAGSPHTRRKLERALSGADRIVYINEITKQKLLELGATQSQLVKIQPGVAAPPHSANHRYNLTKPYIISVGRLIPRKGFDDLIKGFAGLDGKTFPDTSLVIVGSGPERKALEQLAVRSNARVHFLGDIPDEEVAALLQSAALFALTPKHIGGDIEGFGIVYLEAALAGLASIGTRHGGVPEAVLDNKTGILVEEARPDQITDALKRLLQDNQLRATLAAAALARGKELSWENQGRLVLDTLSDIVR